MKYIKLILLLFIANISVAQKTFTNKSLGFNIEEPENWIRAKDGEIVENIKEQVKLDPGFCRIC